MPDERTPSAPVVEPHAPVAVEGSTRVEELVYEATERLMSEIPFGELSVAQIIAAAGVSRATFYYYFSSKFSVLTGLLDRAMDDVFGKIQPFVSRPEDQLPGQAIRRSISQVTRVWRDHRLVLQATSQHWHAVPELRALWLRIAERFITIGTEVIDRERASGVLSPAVSSRQAAALLFWSTERSLHIAGLGLEPSFDDETSLEDALVSMWLGTLYAEKAPAVRP
jgi:AcrR family transcriptional regulator